jgi:hypothetical protein
MLFREEYCEKQEKGGLSNKEKTLLAHPIWKGLAEEERKHYIDKKNDLTTTDLECPSKNSKIMTEN